MRLAGKRTHRDAPLVAEPRQAAGLSEPASSADMAEWVEYAVSKGADREDAEKANKDDLIVAFGSGRHR